MCLRYHRDHSPTLHQKEPSTRSLRVTHREAHSLFLNADRQTGVTVRSGIAGDTKAGRAPRLKAAQTQPRHATRVGVAEGAQGTRRPGQNNRNAGGPKIRSAGAGRMPPRSPWPPPLRALVGRAVDPRELFAGLCSGSSRRRKSPGPSLLLLRQNVSAMSGNIHHPSEH